MFFILMLKGFIIGIAFLIPGLSGGTLAVYLGIYDKLIHSIGNVFKEMKKSLAFLIPVFLGVGLSILLLAKVLGYFLDKNSFITMFFFMGLLLGGMKELFQETKVEKAKPSHIISFISAFVLIILILVLKLMNPASSVSVFDVNIWNFFLIFLLGMISAATMIIPGVSGSAVLLVLGFYSAIVINVIGNVLDFTAIGYNLYVIIPFALGAAVGIIVFSKIIEYFLRKYHAQTYFAIIGFILASAVVLLFEIKDPLSASSFDAQLPIYQEIIAYISNHLFTVLFGVIALAGGYALSWWNASLSKKKM